VGVLSFTVVLVLGIALVPSGSNATPRYAKATGHVVSHAISRAEQNATLKYWTRARMRSATPVDVMNRSGSPIAGAATTAPAGPAGAVAGSSPSGATSSSSLGSAPVPQGFSYPFPFTRFGVSPASLYKKYPWEVNGKVFFTNHGGNYVCSGTSVVSPDGLEVWTAGHCTANTDGTHQFDSFFEFVPSYNGNAASCCPRGIWVADNLGTTTAWLNNGDFSRDMGVAHVVRDSNNRTLAGRVGTAGFAWNQSRDQDFTDFGYPQGSPFNGKFMIECSAAHATDDGGIGGSGPAPIGIGCDMTGGSSGGSWEIGWGGSTLGPSGFGVGYINGHNDYKYGSQPLAMYSPYFDTLANTVRCVFYAPGSGAGC
jgi:hypothetical protein